MPIADPVNLTITEYVDHGTRLELTRQIPLHGNDSITIEVPQGHNRVLYDIVDLHGWRNYERAATGDTSHGLSYEWYFGSSDRLRPYGLYNDWRVYGMVAGGAALLLYACVLAWRETRKEW